MYIVFHNDIHISHYISSLNRNGDTENSHFYILNVSGWFSLIWACSMGVAGAVRQTQNWSRSQRIMSFKVVHML